jgi:hypothetical protein
MPARQDVVHHGSVPHRPQRGGDVYILEVRTQQRTHPEPVSNTSASNAMRIPGRAWMIATIILVSR